MDKGAAESLEEECPTVEAWKWLKGQFVQPRQTMASTFSSLAKRLIFMAYTLTSEVELRDVQCC
jgi:hypothetical protein